MENPVIHKDHQVIPDSQFKSADRYTVEAANSALENVIIAPSTSQHLTFSVDSNNAAIIISSKSAEVG